MPYSFFLRRLIFFLQVHEFPLLPINILDKFTLVIDNLLRIFKKNIYRRKWCMLDSMEALLLEVCIMIACTEHAH